MKGLASLEDFQVVFIVRKPESQVTIHFIAIPALLFMAMLRLVKLDPKCTALYSGGGSLVGRLKCTQGLRFPISLVEIDT